MIGRMINTMRQESILLKEEEPAAAEGALSFGATEPPIMEKVSAIVEDVPVIEGG